MAWQRGYVLCGPFAIYFTLRAVAIEQFEAGHSILNVPYALINTIILIASSVTCQFGVFVAERGQKAVLKVHRRKNGEP